MSSINTCCILSTPPLPSPMSVPQDTEARRQCMGCGQALPSLPHVGWPETKPTTMLMNRAASANILTPEVTVT